MKTAETTTCWKCQGSGFVDVRVSRGCAGDVCFACNGTGSLKVRKPRASKPKPALPTFACYAAIWVVNGEAKGAANWLHETLEGAEAEASSIVPAFGQYEARSINVADTPFNRGRLAQGAQRFPA